MVVVDTNVLAYLLIESAETPLARRVLTADPEWAAPVLWRSEFRNLLATYIRHSRMPIVDAMGYFGDAEKFVHGREHLGDSRTILSLAHESGRSAYDCEFVAVAKDLRVPLITNDRRLRASFPETAVSPAEFLAGRAT